MRAIFSPDRVYRYQLRRFVPASFGFGDRFKGGLVNGYCMFVGLNPSTADETQDDPTIRRCRNFASMWGYTEMVMTNIFAFRATFPEDMKAHGEPVGPENDRWLLESAAGAGLIVACWGNHGAHLERDKQVRVLLPNLHYLRMTGKGQPEHPLYMPGDTWPTEFK